MTETNNGPFGQYASDYVFQADNPSLGRDPDGVLAMRGDGNPGFHQGAVLFDQAIGMCDEATGNTVRDPTSVEEDLLTLEGIRIATDRDLQSRPAKKLDAAEEWLRQNDPNYGKISV